jgi:urease accessory protein
MSIMVTNKRLSVYFVASLATLLFLPQVTNAHISVGEISSFWDGLYHVIGGLDHILVMVAVGVWAAQIGKRVIWLVPLAFIPIMLFGGWICITQILLPCTKMEIAAVNFTLAGLIMFTACFPLGISSSILALLAIFYGYMHGAAIFGTSAGIGYGVGFVFATMIVYLCGFCLTLLIDRFAS